MILSYALTNQDVETERKPTSGQRSPDGGHKKKMGFIFKQMPLPKVILTLSGKLIRQLTAGCLSNMAPE